MPFIVALLAIILTAVGLPCFAQAQTTKPIIFIPGILGSKLCDSTGAVIWGNRDSLWNFGKLEVPLGAAPEELAHRPCGLIESIQIAGPFRVHQYDGLLGYLYGLRYRSDGGLQVFPYDWRLSNFQTAERLKRFIEERYPDPAQQVDIVAHSMGGLVARIYVQKFGGDRRVDRLVMMGTPHRGSGQVFKTVEEGWGWWKNAMAGGLPEIRATLLSFPSVYQLLPSYQNCCLWREAENAPVTGDFSAFDETPWRTFGWLPDRLRTPEGQRFLTGALADGKRLATLLQTDLPASLRHANIVTGLITTQWKSYFHPRSGDFTGQLGNSGDGTVIEWSAANGALSDARATQEEHQRIFEGPIARKTLAWLLGSDSEPRAGFLTAFRGSLLDAKNQEIDLASVTYEASPQVLRPDAAGVMTLKLAGEAALAGADLSNIRLTMGDGASAAQLAATVGPAIPLKDGRVQRTITAPFTAPQDFGVHSIAIEVPGASKFDEYLVVLKP